MTTGELADKLVSWIRESIVAGGCRGAVVGMSGGLDSSVVAVLCHRAFPGSMLGVLMPCYSNDKDREHAYLVASRFSIPTEVMVLDTVFDALLKVLPDNNAEATARRLAQANLKPRLRMLTLYYFANSLKYMVVGAGNRSELSVGYFTKHGDSGVDILPLGNLVKREVRELARFLDIPWEIIDKPPSAGLWSGQTDEDELGFSYEALDHYLTTGVASSDADRKIKAIIAASRHKCQPPPIASF
jgi:NAD+ synthase